MKLPSGPGTPIRGCGRGGARRRPRACRAVSDAHRRSGRHRIGRRPRPARAAVWPAWPRRPRRVSRRWRRSARRSSSSSPATTTRRCCCRATTACSSMDAAEAVLEAVAGVPARADRSAHRSSPAARSRRTRARGAPVRRRLARRAGRRTASSICTATRALAPWRSSPPCASTLGARRVARRVSRFQRRRPVARSAASDSPRRASTARVRSAAVALAGRDQHAAWHADAFRVQVPPTRDADHASELRPSGPLGRASTGR